MQNRYTLLFSEKGVVLHTSSTPNGGCKLVAVMLQASLGTDLLQGGCCSACDDASWPLSKLHQLSAVCHLLHDLLLDKAEVHALHLTLLLLLAGVPAVKS